MIAFNSNKELEEKLESLLTVVYFPKFDELALCYFGGTGGGFSIETAMFKGIRDPKVLRSTCFIELGGFYDPTN